MEGLGIELLLKMIKEIGFPIVIAIWFMIRSDRRQDKILELLFQMVKDEHREKKND